MAITNEESKRDASRRASNESRIRIDQDDTQKLRNKRPIVAELPLMERRKANTFVVTVLLAQANTQGSSEIGEGHGDSEREGAGKGRW